MLTPNHYDSQARPRRWLTAALAALAVASLAGAAGATTYYVNPTGSDSNAGTSSGAPWRTIAKANATLGPGDVVLIANGTYADAINPSRNGTGVGPSQRISYVGNLANPSAVVVAGIGTDKAYISMKGAKSTGSLSLYYTSESAKAMYDSIAYCAASAGISFQGAKNSMIARCNVNADVAFVMDHFYALPPGIVSSISDTLRGCIINIGTITSKGFILRGFTQSCVTDAKQTSGNFLAANGSDIQGRYVYNSYYNTFRNNRWTFAAEASIPGTPYAAFALRDSSNDNL